jgi:hypothetical protein
MDHALGPFYGGPDNELLEMFISSLRFKVICDHRLAFKSFTRKEKRS